ncbi:MAG TPA: ATP-binding protein [Thermomicrobiales bacterium]|nr:ATP-binding protein [Thermomicrobiales bacterium]
MKPIGDFMRNVRVTPPSEGSSNGTIKITRKDDVRCPICNDAGYLRANVPVGHPSFGRLFPCQCKKKELDERRSEELRRLSNLDAFTDHTFEDFDPAIHGTEEAFEAALAFAQEPDHRWLFLTGPCGVGKTHLAVAIAKYAMQWHQMSVYFAVVPDLLDHLRATFDPNSGSAYDDRFTSIRNAPLLVLDDLGTENATPWAREKLYQIINHRYSEQMPTVITSNVELRKVDDRIVSRMLDHRLTQFIEIDAEDYRRPGDSRRVRRGRR